MEDGYRIGPSDMYYVTDEDDLDDGAYYIYRPSNDNYYMPVNNAYYYYGDNVGATLPGDPDAVEGLRACLPSIKYPHCVSLSF